MTAVRKYANNVLPEPPTDVPTLPSKSARYGLSIVTDKESPTKILENANLISTLPNKLLNVSNSINVCKP